MQKNWYILYTKPKCEKKVASLLTKRKTENFCPLNYIKARSTRRNKFLEEPLFKSYVFLNILESEIPDVKEIDGVISFLYWMGKPAQIKDYEIEIVKEFVSDYQNIELEKTQVSSNDTAHIINGPTYSVEGKVFALKNKIVEVNLPSLGYSLVAKIEDEGIFGRDTTILKSNSLLHS